MSTETTAQARIRKTETRAAKLPYERPEIVVYGSVSELVQGNDNRGIYDDSAPRYSTHS